MVTNQMVLQVWTLEFLMVAKCKPCEINKRMCDMYREAFFSQKMLTNELKIGMFL